MIAKVRLACWQPLRARGGTWGEESWTQAKIRPAPVIARTKSFKSPIYICMQWLWREGFSNDLAWYSANDRRAQFGVGEESVTGKGYVLRGMCFRRIISLRPILIDTAYAGNSQTYNKLVIESAKTCVEYTRDCLSHKGDTFPLPRVINLKFPLLPHQKFYITQYGERGSIANTQQMKDYYTTNSHYLTYTFLFELFWECNFWTWEWMG